MAEELNVHLSSVFTREDTSSLPCVAMDHLPGRGRPRKAWNDKIEDRLNFQQQ